MSPRKRPRAAASDTPPPNPNPTPSTSSASTASPAVPTAVPSQASDASADSAMAHSPTGSVAPSVAESTRNASRYASLKDSKNKTRSWYGSWPRKSVASTQVAHETILGGTTKPDGASNLSRYDTRKNGEEGASSDSLGVGSSTLSRKSSTLTLAGAKGNTKSNARPPLSEAQVVDKQKAAKSSENKALNESADSPTAAVATSSNTEPLAEEAMDTAQDNGAPATEEATPAPVPASALLPAPASAGWFSWGRKDTVEAKTPAAADPTQEAPEAPKLEDPGESQAPTPTHAEAPQEVQGPPTIERPTTSGSMWTYLWPGGSRATQPTTSTTTAPLESQEASKAGEQPAEDVVMEDAPSAPIPVPTASSTSSTLGANNASVPATATASIGSTWAFWSRDARKTTGKSPESTASAEQGEMAVMGERSEANPKPALSGVKANGSQTPAKPSSMKDMPVKDAAAKEGFSKEASIKEAARNAASIAAAAAVAAAASKKNKRLRPKSMDIDDNSSVPATPPPEVQTQTPNKGNDVLPAPVKQQQPPRPQTPSGSASTAKGQQTPVKPLPPNLLLPTFRSTYRYKDNPSILRQITQLLLRTQQPPANHVFLAKDLPKFKKAVAIGVHGLFPAAYLRPMIGQPTGTSIRFANHAADAVRRWADNNGCEDCEIEKIALEGEGKIADRVENLWKLLLNWIDHIRKADVVVLACHSQGVPVGFMLLAKLIDLGIVTTARIGVCAMAGVSLGPFPDYKSGLGILMGSAGELWDFANPESEVSKRYEHALKTALDYGVRVAFVGSIDDQVVPLESAIYSPVHHPYVYRAVFVDGRIHAPDFIAHLVGFACKLRNLGVSDHGLIRELSVPLAGSLYSGEGHSRLYDEPQVYDLAVSHCLETASVGKAACEIAKHGSLTNPNPYHLPWIMRGLLEEDFVKTELHAETAELVKQFDEWKPVTKALKDVKYRLEAVRSRL
ncbi:hypothetical protein SBRCBS47491_002885 [Sporothrix bragantina]|uniref:YMC020W-like alpha/beta hydrolase domain-containing protein n=1 Tax=Sporothrix bragantina TaxID=671064 RepID=A0ABP0BAQ2_9PEZI